MEKIALRNYDCDFVENDKKIYYATIENECEILDYISFNNEIDCFTFIQYYNNK